MQREDQSSHRMAYANAKRMLESDNQYVVNDMPVGKYLGRKELTMTQSFIRTRNLLDPAKTQYTFGILNSDVSSSPAGPNNQTNEVEVRLKMQDVFFCYEMGFFVYINSTSAGNASFSYEPITFPNPNLYGSSAGALNLDQMVKIWTAGQMNVTVNGDVLTPAYNLMDHLCMPRTQINPTTWPGGTNPQNYFNQFDGSKDGYCTIEPNWVFNGGNNNIVQVKYPASLSNIGLGTGSQSFHIELLFKGFLAQNASSIMNNMAKKG